MNIVALQSQTDRHLNDGELQRVRIDLAHVADFAIGSIEIHPSTREIRCHDVSHVVEPRVMQVLVALSRADGAILSRDDLIRSCWDGRIVGEDAINRVISRLRRVADDCGGAFQIDTITRVGYRLLHNSRAHEAPAPVLTRTGPRARTALLALLVAAVVMTAWIGLHRGNAAIADQPRVLLVRPFKSSAGDAAAAALDNGFSSDLARLMVGVDPDATSIVDADDPAVGSADYALTGDAQSSGNRLHASARLIDPKTAAILWSRSFDQAAANLTALRGQMATHISDVATCALSRHNPGLRELGLDTMRLYLQACEEKHGDWGRAARLLAQVVDRKPQFAHARAMLAAATAARATELPADAAEPQYQIARREARQALALDPKDSDAYSALVDSRPGISQWIPRQALLSKALALNPRDGDMEIDSAEELMAVGRRNEALVHALRAADLDPFNQWAVAELIREVGYYGDYQGPDCVEPLVAKAAQRWPGDPDIAWQYFLYNMRVGDPATAERLLDDPHRPFPLDKAIESSWRTLIRARQGHDTAGAVAVFVRDARSGPRGNRPFYADALVVLGRPDLALTALEAFEPSEMADANEYFFRDYWAPVRASPRFMKIAARQGLLAVWRKTGRWPDFCSKAERPYDCSKAGSTLA